MLGPSWISLFEQIPAKYHDNLALTMVTGAEIMMQSVLRLESDFVILRGRLAGSTDAGRVIVLPYDQIVNVAFIRPLLEPEVQSIFGKLLESPTKQQEAPSGEADQADAAKAAKGSETEAVDTPNGEEVPLRTIMNRPAAAPAVAKNQSQAPSKSILLARLRARLAEQGK
jgi:hypothetical protein